MKIDKLNEKCAKIKLIVMDVDGTLTNGKVTYSDSGEQEKVFSIRDGMGVELMHRTNIEPAILTSEDSDIVRARAKKLRIKHLICGSRQKKDDLIKLAEKLSLSLENIAYIGDDVNDMQAISVAGVSACPADSAVAILETSDYICKKNGGEGAVREFIELILLAQNKPVTLPEIW